MSIRVSEKHGVNPSIVNCFFCGESKAIALLGRLKGDAEAPRSIVMDYEPCDKCKEKQKEYILAIEATGVQPADKRPPIQQGHYPTGRSVWIRDRVFKDICDSPEIAKQIIEKRVMLCDAQTMQMFIDMFNSIGSEEATEEAAAATTEEATPAVTHSQKTVVARKEWTCTKCGKKIHKTDEYVLKKARRHGKFIFLRECLECSGKEK